MMALPYGTKRIMSSYLFDDTCCKTDSADLLGKHEGPPTLQPATDDAESGGCINEWICEHRWPGIKNLGMLSGAMRRDQWDTTYDNWTNPGGKNRISFSKGGGFFAMNGEF